MYTLAYITARAGQNVAHIGEPETQRGILSGTVQCSCRPLHMSGWWCFEAGIAETEIRVHGGVISLAVEEAAL